MYKCSTVHVFGIDLGKGKGRRRIGHEGTEGEYGYGSILCITSAPDEGGWSTPPPGRFTHGKEARCLLYRRLGGPQDRYGRVRKISPPPGFDPRDRPARSESLYRLSAPGLYIYFMRRIQKQLRVPAIQH